jgi:hypothetical protein
MLILFSGDRYCLLLITTQSLYPSPYIKITIPSLDNHEHQNQCMIKRSLVALGILIGITASHSACSQYYYYNSRYYDAPLIFEAGVGAGVMNSFTDLGGKKGIGKRFIKDLDWKNTKPAFSVYAMGMYKYALGIRLEASFGSVEGADSTLKTVAASTAGRYERNLSFTSKVTDIQLGVEIHPLFFREYDENEAPRISPYVMGGVGFFIFEPMAEFNGRKYALQPLHTEGQGFPEHRDRKPYSLTQINFPVGLGVKYEVNSFLNARFEIVHRILRTDYLDDVSKDYINPDLFALYLPANQATVARQLADRQGELTPGHTTQVGSQRGNPKDNDAFFTIMLKVGVSLGRLRR